MIGEHSRDTHATHRRIGTSFMRITKGELIGMPEIHVLGISGSLRKGSYNTALLNAAKELLPEGMTLEKFDLSAIPPYNEDIRALGYPKTVQEFRSHIAAANALLIATPEYNYSIPGKVASLSPAHPHTNACGRETADVVRGFIYRPRLV